MFADIQAGSATIIPWFVDGETQVNEDTWVQNEQFLVGVNAQSGDGSIVMMVHLHTFLNDPKGAQKLVERVNERNFIDTEHWGYHGYLSLSLEERMREEWVAEDHARRGFHYDGPAAGGHV